MDIKDDLAIQSETLNKKYLGLPLDVGRSRSSSFKYSKDTVWKKILGWMEQLISVFPKIKFLPVGGKETVIKSIAQTVPTYWSCFKLSWGLCEHINFLL